MDDTSSLTVTNLLAKASDLLTTGGYHMIGKGTEDDWPDERGRAFEDGLGIVGIVACESWRELAERWVNDQESLVDLVSRYIGRGEAKAWDVYLVLLTPSLANAQDVMAIRYDTRRVRKLVGTAEELGGLSDIERVLLPLLPLASIPIEVTGTALDILPTLLSKKGISASAVQVLISAFMNEQPLVDELHKQMRN